MPHDHAITKDREGCNLCGSHSTDVLYTVDSCKLVTCQECGLVYVHPQPSPAERNSTHTEIYGSEEYRRQYFQDRQIFEQRFAKKLEEIEHLGKKGAILDVGTSYGFFLDVARKRGWTTCGLEKNTRAVQYAREILGLHVIEGTLEETPFPEHSFDAVTCWDVLEHMPDPFNTLKILKHYLKHDGILCIQSPNIDSFIAHNKKEHWDWLTPRDHLYHFSPRTLTAMLQKAGYDVISVTTWESTSYCIDSLLSYEQCEHPLCALYRKTVLRIIRRVFFPLFIPFQWFEKTRHRGALIVAYAKPQQ